MCAIRLIGHVWLWAAQLPMRMVRRCILHNASSSCLILSTPTCFYFPQILYIPNSTYTFLLPNELPLQTLQMLSSMVIILLANFIHILAFCLSSCAKIPRPDAWAVSVVSTVAFTNISFLNCTMGQIAFTTKKCAMAPHYTTVKFKLLNLPFRVT